MIKLRCAIVYTPFKTECEQRHPRADRYKDGNAIATYERCAKTDYIDKVFTAAETNEAYASLLDPLKNLLNYGSMAQIQFSHSTDTLANEGLYFGDNPIDGMTAENLYDAKAGEFTSTKNIKFLGGNPQQTSTYTIDMSKQNPLETPKSLTLGGWLCTRGGVASYNIRVTSIDGVAVTDPTIVLWQDVSTQIRTDIYTGYGKGVGYTSACANGAGINKATVDLTAWAGHTINFEIVAVTNTGTEIVAINATNVAVPATQ